MAAAFAGVSGGFSANLLIGTIDPLLAGLSTEAANIIDPGYYVMPTANYYFMAVSTYDYLPGCLGDQSLGGAAIGYSTAAR